jgi:hypothetical protein
MPSISISQAEIIKFFHGRANFFRPSIQKGGGWVGTFKGNAFLQKQINRDGTIVSVVRWSNFMGVDGLNGRILLDLPILRKDDSVYFKTSSTTTRNMRRKTLFCFKFTDAKQAEEFEMCWL